MSEILEPSAPKVSGPSGSGAKGSMKRVVAWAKKNPVMAGGIVILVIILAYLAAKNAPKSAGQRDDEYSLEPGELMDEKGMMFGGSEFEDLPYPKFLAPLGGFEYDFSFLDEEEDDEVYGQWDTFVPEEEVNPGIWGGLNIIRDMYFDKAGPANYLPFGAGSQAELDQIRAAFADDPYKGQSNYPGMSSEPARSDPVPISSYYAESSDAYWASSGLPGWLTPGLSGPLTESQAAGKPAPVGSYEQVADYYTGLTPSVTIDTTLRSGLQEF